jgi:hypothetical protein
MALAARSPSDARPKRRSRSSSTSTPPAATITSGPNWGSRTTPRASSTPGGAMAATSMAGPSAAASSAQAARSAASSARPSRTPPASDLWARLGLAVLSATGQPSWPAAVTASSALATATAGGTPTP